MIVPGVHEHDLVQQDVVGIELEVALFADPDKHAVVQAAHHMAAVEAGDGGPGQCDRGAEHQAVQRL